MNTLRLLFFIGFILNHLVSFSQNVYNERLDPRFRSTYKNEKDFTKTIEKYQYKLYHDYIVLLKEMDEKNPKEGFIKARLQNNIDNIEKYRGLLLRKTELEPKFEMHKKLNILFDRFEEVYKKELKEEISVYFVKNLDYWDIKDRYANLSDRRYKLQLARNTFQNEFDDYLKKTQQYKDREDLSVKLSYTEERLYNVTKRLNKFEDAYLYSFDLTKRILKLQTLDKEFLHYALGFDIKNMKKRQRFLLHHAQKEFNEINALPKFQGKDNELRSSALRLAKYFINVAQKSQVGIINFVEANHQVLNQEYKNFSEYQTCKNDHSIFENRKEHVAYINNPPSIKNITKFDGLVAKYSEKLEKNLISYELTLQNMFNNYLKK
jgi:hypothetical protein